jgi:hypothetical protein
MGQVWKFAIHGSTVQPQSKCRLKASATALPVEQRLGALIHPNVCRLGQSGRRRKSVSLILGGTIDPPLSVSENGKLRRSLLVRDVSDPAHQREHVPLALVRSEQHRRKFGLGANPAKIWLNIWSMVFPVYSVPEQTLSVDSGSVS